MKLLTSIAIIMQSKNCSEIHEQVLSEPSRSQTHLATRAHMEQTINNIKNYNYVVNIFVIIENKCNNRKSWRWFKRHAGGGRETMIQFVVALP